MIYRILIVIIIFVIYPNPSSPRGLCIEGNRSLIDERSSYSVFDRIEPTFNRVLTLDFSIFLEAPHTRGNITRIKNEETDNAYNISYNGESNTPVFTLSHEGRNTLISIPYDKGVLNGGRWIEIRVEFDMVLDSVKLQIDDQSGKAELKMGIKRWKPSIYFGRSEHVIDISSIKLRNLTVGNSDKSYYFPLNESEGELVHDSNGKVIGRVLNPEWMINDAYHWRERSSFSSQRVAGSNFNPDRQEVYYLNEDSITIYNLRTEEIQSYVYTNACPMEMRLGTNFIDLKNNRLYVYEVADPPSGDVMMAYLDLSSLSWKIVTNESLPMQLHHHSNYMDAEKSRYIIFGGCGGTSYFNDFHSFDLESNRWMTLNFSGDTITPRYFTSMGYNNSDSCLYLFGGMGNSSGDQTVGRVYYYELYRIDMESGVIEKMWEIPWGGENVVPVRSMVFDQSGGFYTLCYPEHSSHSHLMFYRFSIADGQYEVLGDSIPILSEKITTNANIYYNPHSDEVVSVIQEFDYNDISSVAKVYTISSPPVAVSELTIYNDGDTRWRWIAIPAFAALIIFSACTLLFFRRRNLKQKNKTLRKSGISIGDKSKSKTITPSIPIRNNSIFIFGEFSMINRNGREINYMLSAKLRQAFFLILHHTLGKGITSQEFSQHMWPDKSYVDAKNSRGVMLNNLRKVLDELDGLELEYEKGVYKMAFSSECYCDYLRGLEIALNVDVEDSAQQAEFISIVSRGKILQAEEIEFLDRFKEHLERRIEPIMYAYMKRSYLSGNYEATISLCESIFNLDPLDEETLHYMVKSLSKLGFKGEAKQRYYLFTAEYKKTQGEDYSKSFAELSK